MELKKSLEGLRVDPYKFFGTVSKIPIVGEFIIACAIYFVLNVILATTDGFGLAFEYRAWFRYLFLALSVAFFTISLSYRGWNLYKKMTKKEDEEKIF
jgi:hypothetical protein